MENMQDKKILTFSAEKCESLRINPKPYSVGAILTVNNAQVKMVEFTCYLGDYFNTGGDNTTLCKERCFRAKGSTVELIALCKEIKAMFTLYRIVKRSVAESVPDRASVHTRNAAFEAVSAPEQNCSAPLLKVEGSVSDRFLKRSESSLNIL